ncbi:MAG: ROK family protein [Candidatus Pacebacteria bacterium]|nr:ROK family protein [Candidatus Paceibacterota bacterium]
MSALSKKQRKHNRLLRLIRRQAPVSRMELARQLPWSTSSVCGLVQELIDRGLVLEQLEGGERRGREPVPLRPNPVFARYMGFDLEAMHMRLVCVDFAGNVCWKQQRGMDAVEMGRDVVKQSLAFIDEGLAAAATEDGGPVVGIGVAAPGICDVRHGAILHYDMLPAVRNLPLRDLIGQHTGLPCVLDNNIRAYTLAEWLLGAGQHLSNFICFGVRSGIGAGIVLDGRLVQGSHGFAGEAGHSPVFGISSVDKWRTLEATVSEKALGVNTTDGGIQRLSDSRAKRAGEFLGGYLAGLATLVDPQAIILAGALVQSESPLWGPLQAAFRQHVLPDIVDKVPLLPSRVGPFAAAIGITQSCFESAYPSAGQD